MQRDIIAEFHDALMDFMDHFKEEAEAQAENIIRDPAEMLSTLLDETLADHSDKTNDNGSPVTYGTMLDALSNQYREEEDE